MSATFSRAIRTILSIPYKSSPAVSRSCGCLSRTLLPWFTLAILWKKPNDRWIRAWPERGTGFRPDGCNGTFPEPLRISGFGCKGARSWLRPVSQKLFSKINRGWNKDVTEMAQVVPARADGCCNGGDSLHSLPNVWPPENGRAERGSGACHAGKDCPGRAFGRDHMRLHGLPRPAGFYPVRRRGDSGDQRG